jgi:hypothetical protein
MKKTMRSLCLLLSTIVIIGGCSSSKDNEKSKELVGTYTEADKQATDNNPETNEIKWEFEKNGQLTYTYNEIFQNYPPNESTEPQTEPTDESIEPIEAPIESYPETTISSKLIYSGKWELKDDKLTIKFESVKADGNNSLDAKELQGMLCEKQNEKFKSLEIISDEEKKIVFKDKDGEKHTLTKSKE